MGESAVNPKIEAGWKQELGAEFRKPYFAELKRFLLEERGRRAAILPPGALIFNAFNHTPFNAVKVVLLGQDPYPTPGNAHGLCFSVLPGVAPPPSLQNMFSELKKDVGFKIPDHGNLEAWARQGVLLLNACLTVRAFAPGSHQGRGWEEFTAAAIQRLSEKHADLVFLLWGRQAQMKEGLIDAKRHHILKAAHPSPMSADRGFFGCRHFSKTNALLKKAGKSPIDWQI
jgi:uracil-DNA glycosylase